MDCDGVKPRLSPSSDLQQIVGRRKIVRVRHRWEGECKQFREYKYKYKYKYKHKYKYKYKCKYKNKYKYKCKYKYKYPKWSHNGIAIVLKQYPRP